MYEAKEYRKDSVVKVCDRLRGLRGLGLVIDFLFFSTIDVALSFLSMRTFLRLTAPLLCAANFGFKVAWPAS